MSAVLQCLHIPTILLKRFFQSNFFGLKWPVVNFHTFGGSNKAQISIFGVKYSRDPTTKGPPSLFFYYFFLGGDTLHVVLDLIIFLLFSPFYIYACNLFMESTIVHFQAIS